MRRRVPEPAAEAAPSLAARLWSFAARTPGSAAIVVICVAVFAYTSWASRHDPDGLALLRCGASERSHLWRGEYWRLVTPMFLHGGAFHLGANMVFGTTWNLAVERTLGTRRFLLLYLLSGVFGTATSVLLHDAMSVGASGAMFGMIGVVLVLQLRASGSFARFVRNPSVRSLVFSIAMWIAIGFQLGGIDNAAHLGGLFYGGVLAYVITAHLRPMDDPRPAPPPEPGAHRIHWAMALTVLAFAVAAACRRWPNQRARVGGYEASLRAVAAIRANDLATAEREATRAVELDDASPKLFALRGAIRQERGDAKGAEADYERALRSAEPDWAGRDEVADNLAALREAKGAPSTSSSAPRR
jgi:membrane associated rhomboid family serine protease